MATVFTNNVVPQAPTDPLFGLMAEYKADTFAKKVDLGVGAYRTNEGRPFILPAVKKVCIILYGLPAVFDGD
jgi:aspartate aminotransferase, cytoplasmic